MDITAYLQRIGYNGPRDPTLGTLRDLQLAHLLTVPFENLDITRGRQIMVDGELFVAKVVRERRGGFCYELNGALAVLLQALGFEVTLLSARVPRKDGSEGPEFDHLALRVDLDEPWLVDVGFGDSFLSPLWLGPEVEQAQPDGRLFRIVERRDNTLEVQRKDNGVWKTEYGFTIQPRRLEEFAEMCSYHQNSPESPFTRKTICSRATADGRITIADSTLIITRAGKREETLIGSDEERNEILRREFGIVLQ